MNRFFPIVCLVFAFSITSFSWAQDQVELKNKTVLGGQLDLLLPSNFETLQEDKVKEGEDANIIYENESRTVSLTLNYSTGAANQEIIPAFLESFAGSFDETYKIKEWKNKKVIDANGHKVGTMEFVTTEENDTEAYYLVFYTDVNSRLLVATFNCSKDDMEEWAPLANKIVNSIKTK